MIITVLLIFKFKVDFLSALGFLGFDFFCIFRNPCLKQAGAFRNPQSLEDRPPKGPAQNQ